MPAGVIYHKSKIKSSPLLPCRPDPNDLTPLGEFSMLQLAFRRGGETRVYVPSKSTYSQFYDHTLPGTTHAWEGSLKFALEGGFLGHGCVGWHKGITILDLTKTPLSTALFEIHAEASEAVKCAILKIPRRMTVKTRLSVYQGLMSVESWYLQREKALEQLNYGAWGSSPCGSLDKFLSTYVEYFTTRKSLRDLSEMGVKSRTWDWFTQWVWKEFGISLRETDTASAEGMDKRRREEILEKPKRAHISLDITDPELLYYERKKGVI